jgi:flagella basal body P-ring formation protein FlgA
MSMRLPLSLLAAAALAFGWSASAEAGAAPIQIALTASVGVARTEVSLGDIATLTTTDLGTLKQLMALPLGPAPRAGEKAQLGQAELARWIHAQTGIVAGRIIWEGPSITTVHRASTEISSSRLLAVANDSLRAWLASHAQSAEVVLVTSPRDVPVPLGRTTLVPRPIAREAYMGKRVVVWIDVWVEEQFLRTVPVGFEVTAYGAARQAEKNESAAAPAVSAVASSVPPPTIVNARADVRQAPGVSRGDWVALSLRNGSIEMESRVEALQSGRLGQVVSVKPPKSTEALLARVIGHGRVEAGQ